MCNNDLKIETNYNIDIDKLKEYIMFGFFVTKTSFQKKFNSILQKHIHHIKNDGKSLWSYEISKDSKYVSSYLWMWLVDNESTLYDIRKMIINNFLSSKTYEYLHSSYLKDFLLNLLVENPLILGRNKSSDKGLVNQFLNLYCEFCITSHNVRMIVPSKNPNEINQMKKQIPIIKNNYEDILNFLFKIHFNIYKEFYPNSIQDFIHSNVHNNSSYKMPYLYKHKINNKIYTFHFEFFKDTSGKLYNVNFYSP